MNIFTLFLNQFVYQPKIIRSVTKEISIFHKCFFQQFEAAYQVHRSSAKSLQSYDIFILSSQV